MKDNGAAFAKSPGDLDFLSKAEAEDTASMFGFTYDKSAELYVDLWEDGDDPREWLMWAAQPFDEDKSPNEIVEAAPSSSYVAYIVNASPRKRQALKACTA